LTTAISNSLSQPGWVTGICVNSLCACGLADDPLFGQRLGAMPRCGNGGFSDTVKVELGQQLGQAVS